MFASAPRQTQHRTDISLLLNVKAINDCPICTLVVHYYNDAPYLRRNRVIQRLPYLSLATISNQLLNYGDFIRIVGEQTFHKFRKLHGVELLINVGSLLSIITILPITSPLHRRPPLNIARRQQSKVNNAPLSREINYPIHLSLEATLDRFTFELPLNIRENSHGN